ncbi:hypothetical protein D3C75_848570 [compost metagenome]
MVVIENSPFGIVDDATSLVERQAGKCCSTVADSTQNQASIQKRLFISRLRIQIPTHIEHKMIAHDSQLLDSTVARQRHRRCQKAQNDAFVTDLGLPLDQAPESLEFAYCFPISAHQKLIMLTRQHFALDNDIHTTS